MRFWIDRHVSILDQIEAVLLESLESRLDRQDGKFGERLVRESRKWSLPTRATRNKNCAKH